MRHRLKLLLVVTDTLACIKKWQNKMTSSKVEYNSNNIHRQDPGFIILHNITGRKNKFLQRILHKMGLPVPISLEIWRANVWPETEAAARCTQKATCLLDRFALFSQSWMLWNMLECVNGVAARTLQSSYRCSCLAHIKHQQWSILQILTSMSYMLATDHYSSIQTAFPVWRERASVHDWGYQQYEDLDSKWVQDDPS